MVEKLENNGAGLNLTFEVKDGIVNHTGDSVASTLEGVIVKFADRIAYINHDIDDACRGGVLDESDIPDSILSVLGYILNPVKTEVIWFICFEIGATMCKKCLTYCPCWCTILKGIFC